MKKITFVVIILMFLYQANSVAQAWQWAVSSETNESYYTTTDPSGNVYQIGKFAGDATFQGGVTLSQGGAFYNNWFLAKYTTAGQLLWAKEVFSQRSNTREILALNSDEQGNVYIAGYFGDTLRVGTSNAISHGDRDAFLVKLTDAGTLSWIKTGGGTGDDQFTDLVCQGANVYVVGSFTPDATFESITLSGATSNMSREAMLLSYSSTGTLNFAKSFGGIADEVADAVTFYNNKIYFSGFFRSLTCSFQSINLPWTGTAGQYDVFMACTDLNGTIEWAKGYNSQTSNLWFRKQNCIAANASGLYLSGQFEKQINFGNGPLTTTSAAQSSYLAKFDFTGTIDWATTFLGHKLVSAKKLRTTSDKIYLAGNFTDTLNLLGQNYIGKFSSYAVAETNGFITSWNSDGSLAWIKTVVPYQENGLTGSFGISDMSVYNNYLYISGFFTNTVNLFPFAPSTDGVTGNMDALLAKIDVNANGVQEQNSLNVSIFPNPANHQITIETDVADNYSVKIKSVNGQTVLSQIMSGTNRATIDICELSSGVYFLELATSKGVRVKKLIVQ